MVCHGDPGILEGPSDGGWPRGPGLDPPHRLGGRRSAGSYTGIYGINGKKGIYGIPGLP